MVVFVFPVTDEANLIRLNAIRNAPDHVTQLDMGEEIVAGFMSMAGIQDCRNTHLIPLAPIIMESVHYVCSFFVLHRSC